MLKKFVFGLGCFMVTYGAATAGTLSVRDSVGVKSQNGKIYITHKVEPNETLYALSRKYRVPVEQIVAANKNIQTAIMVGQLVLVPMKANQPASTASSVIAAKTTSAASASAPATASTPATSSPAANRTYTVDGKGNKMHTVKANQTLYSISRLHNVAVEDVKKWNQLSTNTVSVGQSLIVGVGVKALAQAAAKSQIYVPEKDDAVAALKQPETPVTPATTTATSAGSADPVKASVKTNNTPATKTDAEEVKTASKTSEYVSRVNESGMAEQIDQKSDVNKFLALHKSAPVGTIMAVKNPMNDQTVYVRVIGKLPATGDNDKLVVKLSKKACQQIGAVDKRFRVELSYMP